MAIASPSTPSFSSTTTLYLRLAEPSRLPRSARFPSITATISHRLSVTCRLNNSSKPSAAGGSVNNNSSNGGEEYELQHSFASPPRRGGTPVFVALPVDAVGPGGQVRRRKAMVQSLRALAAAGVEGVVMEVWWGIVEREEPRVYDWGGYLDLLALVRRCGLYVRVVLAFHQCGTGPGDPHWIPLPQWVVEEIVRDPDIAYSDRFGRRNMEYISLGCDILPVLRGRSPLQAYADFMREFRKTFGPFLGITITGIQVGMGPAGELRYPSRPSQTLAWSWRSHGLGEFQCYDKYMLASLDACARKTGMHEWGSGGLIGASSLMQDLENTEFFRSEGGSWNTPYGQFFLEWYVGQLLLHGERICREARTVFWGTEVNTSAKVAGIPWHYNTQSHPSELTAGYYNTSIRDGYLPIVRMFGRYGFTICCAGFEMQDEEEKQTNPPSSPEGFLRQLLLAARHCDLPMEGENSAMNLDEESFQQVVRISKVHAGSLERPSFSFNFMRMDKNMFEYGNWARFTRFVRQMSDVNIFRVGLSFGGSIRLSSSMPDAVKAGFAFAYC